MAKALYKALAVLSHGYREVKLWRDYSSRLLKEAAFPLSILTNLLRRNDIGIQILVKILGRDTFCLRTTQFRGLTCPE